MIGDILQFSYPFAILVFVGTIHQQTTNFVVHSNIFYGVRTDVHHFTGRARIEVVVSNMTL